MLRRLLDSPWLYFGAAGLLLLVALASQFEFRWNPRPVREAEELLGLRDRDDLNVVFVTIDTLRADRLTAYGYERPTSRFIDSLARTGIRFARTVAQSSWTKTSMASLWTGTLPANNGVLRFNHGLPEEALLPAEIFKQAGFRTAGIFRNGWVAPNFGFSQGFDTYLKPRPGRERAQIQRGNPSTHALQGTDEDLIQSAREFLGNFAQQRFFLYLHFMDIHQYLYDTQSAIFGTSYSDAYDQSIHWTDRLVEALYVALEDFGAASHTLLVITADHGEAFGEHGLEGHARNLYQEVTSVPFIIVPPFQLEPGIVVEQLVSNVDVFPTILDLVGLPALPNADGISLVPLILAAARGEERSPATEAFDRPIFGQIDQYWGRTGREPRPLVSVTRGQTRVVKEMKRGVIEVYDHASDPLEAEDLAAERKEQVQPLVEALDRYMGDAKSPWGAPPNDVEIDEMQSAQLRALGYVVK